MTILGQRERLLSGMAVMLFCLNTISASAEIVDSLKFGDGASETAHGLAKKDSRSLEDGGLGESFRVLDPPGGKLLFTMQVHPGKQNYLTVKFWGSDDSAGRVFALFLNDTDVKPQLLDDETSARIHPGRWYYVTRMIPESRIEEKSSSLMIELSSTGPYAAYSWGQKDREQVLPSRGIYAAYTHTDPMFVPPAAEKQGAAVGPYELGEYQPPTPEKILAVRQHLYEVADRQVELARGWQRYAPDWREKVKSGKWPGPMVGGFFVRGGPNLQDIKDATHKFNMRHDNMGPLKGVRILSLGYTLEGCKYYKNKELLDRIAVGLDYARRAQGRNGAYVDVWQWKWVGGPNRRKGAGALEGDAHEALALAFIDVYEDMEKQGFLDELVDADADPDTPPKTTRRQAYIDLFSGSVDYLIDRYGHAPNQDLMNVNGFYPAVRALRILAPERTADLYDSEKVQTRLRVTCGQQTSPKKNAGHFFTEKGVAREGGGFSSDYGQGLASNMWRLANLTGVQFLRQRAIAAAQVWPHFWYPAYHEDRRIDLRVEAAINTRNVTRNGGAAGPHQFMLLELNDPLHIRAFQLRIMQGDYTDVEGLQPSADGGHRLTRAIQIMQQMHTIPAILSDLPPLESVRLPFEMGQPDFAWACEMTPVVAAKLGDNRFFAHLHWRNGGTAMVNNHARVHYTTPAIERIADVNMQSPLGYGKLYLLKYGPFLIAMNADIKNSYSLKSVKDMTVNRSLQDLVSGRTIDLDRDKLPPRTTLVLVTESGF